MGLFALRFTLDEAELNRVIAVRRRRLSLGYYTRAGLQYRYRHHLTVRAKHLRHPDFFAKNSWAHVLQSLQKPIAAVNTDCRRLKNACAHLKP